MRIDILDEEVRNGETMKKMGILGKKASLNKELGKRDIHRVRNRNWSFIEEEGNSMIKKRDIKSRKKEASNFSNSKVKGFNPILLGN